MPCKSRKVVIFRILDFYRLSDLECPDFVGTTGLGCCIPPCFLVSLQQVGNVRNGLLPCFGTFKMPILMFISILVFRPEGQILNPVRRDTRIYVRRTLNASRISKTQLNSCTIRPS